MCISWKRHIAAALLLLCLPLVVVGCGGGGGGGGGSTATVSGIATKGPIADGVVSVYRLLEDGTRGALVGSGTTGADGSYSVAVPVTVTGPLIITVSGRPGATYTSETTGLPVPFSAAEAFSAAVDSFTPGVDVAVSPLTDIAVKKLPLVIAEKPGARSAEKLQSSIVAANTLVGRLFNVSNILAPPAGDPTYQAALMVVDQMVENSKAGGTIVDTTAVMTILSQAVVDTTPTAPVYQTFIEVFTAAAEAVKVNNPGSVAIVVDSITAQTTNPPAEPDFSDVTAPTTVTGLAATTSAINTASSSVLLSWTASTDSNGVAGYDVYREGNKVGTTVTPAFTDPAVTSNVTYLYTVVAFDAAGNRAAASAALSVRPSQPSLNVTVNGHLSDGILALPENDIYAPTAPTNLSAVTAALDGATSSVALSWGAATDNFGVTGYDVYRDGAKIGTSTTTSYSDSSVTSNVTYVYYLRAFDAAGFRSAAGTTLSVKPNQASLGVTVSGRVSDTP